jgi:hypothetical protein
MVLVIGAISLVLGLCASVLSGLFKVERGGRAALADATTLSRLARQFRKDVRAAAAVKRSGGGSSGLELSGPDGAAIVYRVEGGRVLREDRRGVTVRARESFAAERLGPVSFGDDSGMVWAAFARRAAASPGPARPEVRVEATLGKDRGTAEPTGGER